MFDFFCRRIREIRNDRDVQSEILYITCNRLPYTRVTLPALLDSDSSFSVTIVDNSSTDGTLNYLQSLDHPNIRQIIRNRSNRGLVLPTKEFWRNSRAEFVGKIDNDIVVPKNWISNLVAAHRNIDNLGVIGYCHFRCDDYDPQVAAGQVKEINGVFLRLQPWIGGNYLARREVFLKNPDYRQSYRGLRRRILLGFNSYQQRLAQRGYLHGYLADSERNLYHWTHLDDPREPEFMPESAARSSRKLTPDQIVKWYRRDAKHLLEDS